MLEFSYNYSIEKFILLPEELPQTLMPWPNKFPAKKLFFPLYLEVPLLSGMEAVSEVPLHGYILERNLIPKFQVDELNSANEYRLNIVFEEMKKIGISSTESKRQWTKTSLRM